MNNKNKLLLGAAVLLLGVFDQAYAIGDGAMNCFEEMYDNNGSPIACTPGDHLSCFLSGQSVACECGGSDNWWSCSFDVKPPKGSGGPSPVSQPGTGSMPEIVKLTDPQGNTFTGKEAQGKFNELVGKYNLKSESESFKEYMKQKYPKDYETKMSQMESDFQKFISTTIGDQPDQQGFLRRFFCWVSGGEYVVTGYLQHGCKYPQDRL